jgi:hypothetical protein
LQKLLPSPERDFGLGWSRMVDILAASTFPTDLITLVEDGAGFLPKVVITDEVVRQWNGIDEEKEQISFVELCGQRSVRTTHKLVRTDDDTLNTMVWFWSRVVRSPRTSRAMPVRVNRLVHGNFLVKLKELVKILVLFLRP